MKNIRQKKAQISLTIFTILTILALANTLVLLRTYGMFSGIFSILLFACIIWAAILQCNGKNFIVKNRSCFLRYLIFSTTVVLLLTFLIFTLLLQDKSIAFGKIVLSERELRLVGNVLLGTVIAGYYTCLFVPKYTKYDYKVISMYYEKNKFLYLISTGELLSFGGDIDVETVVSIQLPSTNEILEKEIKECFEKCWKTKVKEIPKGQSIIENHLNIKGYKKIVEKYEFLRLHCDTDVRTFKLLYDFKKEKNHYSNPKTYDFGKTIDFDYLKKIIQG